MQFVRSRRHIKLSGERNPNLYPHALQFYKLPPLETITLEEFEAMALERLQVLRIVDRATVKHFKNYRDLREAVLTDLRKQNLSSYCKITVDENKIDDQIFDDRRKDHISHFILRLAYCRSENLRRWFVTQEVDLFRIRFMSETGSNRRLLMELNDLDYKPIDKEEKKSIIAKLASCAFNNSSSQVALTDYYKVPFIEVLDLVRSRKIFLRNGYAYISESNLVSIVVTAFRSHLSHALAITSRALPQLEEDERLLSMLSTLHQRYVGDNYNDKAYKSSGEISPDMLDSISKTSYPLCMSTLHESLRKNHHLKYGGRLVYGLFLKGIGMTLEDSIRFWRNEFTKIMDVDKFDKQYSYNIRHNYGKEGKRANYTPHNCMKIISNAPGPGDAHGCPFKHCDTSTLKQKLQSLHINSSGITDIMNFVEKGHYQLACTRYFEATHNEATVNQAISHPNQYFEESQKQRKGTTKTTERNVREVPSTKVLLYNSTEGSSQNSTQIDLTDSALLEDIEDFLINSQE